MNSLAQFGWDVGGAHLKAVMLDGNRQILHIVQHPCPLWRGLDQLDTALQHILSHWGGRAVTHAITMTGELADIFPDRAQGVQQIAERMVRQLGGQKSSFYAGPEGFVALPLVQTHAAVIASANWHASATCVAHSVCEGLLIDIGSTTTDIIPISSAGPMAQGYTDSERMRHDELMYTGVVRTPVMAVAQALPFNGAWQSVAAEHFATMGDVYRLTGQLLPQDDMAETADGQGKTTLDSARRLARMIGYDHQDAELSQWRELAKACRSQQLHRLQCGVERVLSATKLSMEAPLIGAGAGKFLAEMLAYRLDRPFVDAAGLIASVPEFQSSVGLCLPAYAVAQLAMERRLS